MEVVCINDMNFKFITINRRYEVIRTAYFDGDKYVDINNNDINNFDHRKISIEIINDENTYLYFYPIICFDIISRIRNEKLEKILCNIT